MSPRRAALAALLVVGMLAGCSGVAVPTATPQDMTGVLSALVLRGVTIRQVTGGDAGCPGSALHSNAARIDLTLAADGRDYTVYLFRWRRPADYDAAAAPFAACVEQHAAASPARSADAIEVRPWRAYGSGWSQALNAVLHETLRAAGGD